MLSLRNRTDDKEGCGSSTNRAHIQNETKSLQLLYTMYVKSHYDTLGTHVT